MLKKLKKNVFDKNSVSWLYSYLEGRRQCVLGNNNSKSDWEEVQNGVPQGSVLGPVLFILYLNDICLEVPKIMKLIYADDLQIYLHSSFTSLLPSSDEMKSLIEKILA